jgi:hypothetical protein
VVVDGPFERPVEFVFGFDRESTGEDWSVSARIDNRVMFDQEPGYTRVTVR